jgi:hypothetical protein
MPSNAEDATVNFDFRSKANPKTSKHAIYIIVVLQGYVQKYTSVINPTVCKTNSKPYNMHNINREISTTYENL